MDSLINAPTGLDIKPLKGRPELQLRVGKYRVLFKEDRENQLYIVTAIGSDRNVYKLGSIAFWRKMQVRSHLEKDGSAIALVDILDREDRIWYNIYYNYKKM